MMTIFASLLASAGCYGLSPEFFKSLYTSQEPSRPKKSNSQFVTPFMPVHLNKKKNQPVNREMIRSTI
jgi:hypothetical protein